VRIAYADDSVELFRAHADVDCEHEELLRLYGNVSILFFSLHDRTDLMDKKFPGTSEKTKAQ